MTSRLDDSGVSARNGQVLPHEASNTSMASVDVDMHTPLVANEPAWALSYRKWRLLPMSVSLAFTCALPYCLAILIHPVQVACPQWPATTTTHVNAVQVAFCALASLFSGPMIMKYGVRLPGLLFTLLGTAGMLLASVAVRTRAVWLYYVGLAPCVGLCIGVTFFIAIQHIVRWLVTRRGFAGSFFGFFIGVGSVVTTLALKAFVHAMPTHDVFLVLAAALFAVNTGPFLIMRLPPAASKAGTVNATAPVRQLTYGDMLQTRRFYVFWLVFVGSLMVGWGIVASATVLFTTVGGVSHSTADTLTSCMYFAYMVARALAGTVSDYCGRMNMYIAFMGVQCVICAVLPFITSFDLFYACIVLLILIYGGSKVMFSGVAVDLFGPANAAKAIALIGTGYGTAGLLGPIVYTATSPSSGASVSPGSNRHKTFFLIMAGVSGLAFAMALLLRFHILRPRSRAKATP